MSLQLALLLIGLFIVGIVAISAFAGARRRREVAPSQEEAVRRVAPVLGESEHFPEPEIEDDRLDINPAAAAMAAGRSLRSDIPVTPAAPDPEVQRRRELEMLEEVAAMPLDLSSGAERKQAGTPGKPVSPEASIDFVIGLPGETLITRDAALGIYKQNEYRLDKPRRLYGFNVDAGYWTDLDRDPAQSRYSDLAVAIQLTDAKGPLSETELNTFAQLGLKLADGLHRPTKFSASFEAALERAKRLHRFCEAFDVIAAVSVEAADKAVFRTHVVRDAAQKLGMQYGPRNIFHMKSMATPGCHHLFSMAAMVQPGEFDPATWETGVVPGVTLFMSVPCAYRPVAVFDRLIDAARKLARALGGELLDQDHRPLNDRGVAVIRHQIGEIEEKMRAFGIQPGSAAALRLFDGSTIAEAAAPLYTATTDG